MKPLISYYGGKQRMASKIVPLLPPHTVYVEPFAGGLSVLFAKGKPPITNNDHYREVINDLNGNLVTLYRVAQLQPEILQREINATLHSRRDYYRAVDVYKHPEGHDDLTVAWATYVGFMQAFSNVIGSSWRISAKGRNDSVTWHNRKLDLRQRIERLADCYIEQRDALDVIKTWDSPQTLFYCDPPYPGANQGYYSGYTQEDFQALLDVLVECKGSFVLSNYPNDTVPKEWPRHDLKATMTASPGESKVVHNTKRTECLWIVDRSANMPQDLARIATHYGTTNPKASL